jgi:DsbC/DsbD-like thiol-disulfide interchange protein
MAATSRSCRPDVISDFAGRAYKQGMIRYALIAALLSAALGAPVGATTQDDVVSATLLQGWQTDHGSTMVAVRLTLTPGWKTYWRSPGDAGIPPSFDWSGSDNLGAVHVHWPRPAVFQTNGLTSIGYHDELVLPVEIFPAVAGQPIRVELQMDVGVCKDICLPASLIVSGDALADGTGSPAIKAALAQRPDNATGTPITCEIAPIKDGLRVNAHLNLTALGRDETVIFESGMPGVWVSQADTIRQGNQLTASVDMVGASGAPFVLDRSGVVLTIVAGDRAVELTGCPSGN